MLILAIDSATPTAGVALLNDERLLKEEFSNFSKTHAETLMPMVKRVLQECLCRVDDLDGIAVSKGPGSFTGLRIGMATAKGLCLGSGKPLITVSTLEMLAANICAWETLVCPILDARKNEVYTAMYLAQPGQPQCVIPPEALAPEMAAELIKGTTLQMGKDRCLLLGDGLFTYGTYLKEELGEAFYQAPPHLALPRASTLATLAMERFKQGLTEDVFAVHPCYLRLSEAEVRRKKGECKC